MAEKLLGIAVPGRVEELERVGSGRLPVPVSKTAEITDIEGPEVGRNTFAYRGSRTARIDAL
jgi:hypothetical protein